MEKTPRKSLRLKKFVVVVDSPPISCSRPSGRTNECIVINSSSSYKVQQKDDYGADTKSKGKEKLLEDHYPHDNDFEDEIPLSKRLRVNNDQDLKNVDGGSVSKGMNDLSQKWTRFINNKRKKATQVPLKVLEADFIRVFKEGGLIQKEDFFNMSMIYFISTFILSSPPQLSHIPKDHFLCVESGQYITYPWGNFSFFNLRHSISSQKAKDPDYVKFEGFPLALQIWFYECCDKLDGSIAIRKSNRTPRIFNWDISENKIYFDHLQKGMFRKYGNQYTFEDLLFMNEELAIIEAENLTVLTDIPFNKKSKRDRSVRKNENLQTHCVVRQNVKDLPHSSAQKVEVIRKIAQEVVKVRNELEKFEKNVDAKFVEMKDYMDSSFKHIIQELKSLQNDVSTNKDLGGERLVALETGQTHVSSLAEVESENICVTPLKVAIVGKTKFNQFGVIKGENTFISPVQHVRTKIPGKYVQSPYTNLSESGGTSVNIVKYCLWRHPFVNCKGFEMYSEVILHFKKWVDSKLSKKRGKKTSFFTVASNPIDPPFVFGVGRVDLMDWFHPSAYPGQPWRDLHVDVIMYYLHKFCKYGPDNSSRVTTTDPFFISWVVQIHDAWEANDKVEGLISIHHEVAQYIRGDRILANTPWVNVDHVCIPVNSSAAFHWFLVVFSIRKRCLYIYDSLKGYGVKHTNAVTCLVQKISRMIPLFLVATDYYALRKDIDWITDVHYARRPVDDPLVYGNREYILQLRDNSTDCGLYSFAFAEYVCRGDRNISMPGLNAENLRLRFGALLWEYGKMKIHTESVSEDEASKQGGRSNRRVKE
ncbi:hypothetical protein KY290_034109 [Solanum tuberosum]|uniref:Ubiquitin-like protease family profile domain-containing protein n=1 Tax=Solanum tuberosum TaxID=4113 RepID=A0ABQ7U2N9_SOLTU|nr:hypothetical protein KY289_033501 [Solanum tuberosum]KAH0741066.1 hypothetical protein KY290_034109 [Solanum tuberosum]